ncbi:MAG: hypothetical protein AAFV45_00490 [Pseudomonadota bacterium]
MTRSKTATAAFVALAVMSFSALSAQASPMSGWGGTGVSADTFKGD